MPVFPGFLEIIRVVQTRPNLPDGLILDLFIVSGMEFFLNISG